MATLSFTSVQVRSESVQKLFQKLCNCIRRHGTKPVEGAASDVGGTSAVASKASSPASQSQIHDRSAVALYQTHASRFSNQAHTLGNNQQKTWRKSAVRRSDVMRRTRRSVSGDRDLRKR
jgi:hypothetical protein